MHLVALELMALRKRGLSADAYDLWRDAVSRWPDFQDFYEQTVCRFPVRMSAMSERGLFSQQPFYLPGINGGIASGAGGKAPQSS